MGSPYRPATLRGASASPAALRTADRYFELKSEIHKKLLGVLNYERLSSIPKERVRAEIGRVVERLLEEERVPMTTAEQNRIVEEVLDEVLGLGPLEPLLKEPSISDILVNGYAKVYIERNGKLALTPVRFRDNAHLLHIIEKIVSQVGRRIDEAQPIVDARLPDGSRVNAIIPPLALDGPIVSIRRFAADPLEMDDLIALKTLTPQMAEIFKGIAKTRLNVLISGGTGSGKTTMLNVISRFIGEHERIVTIEDAAELQLKQEHVVRLETRPANIEGKGEVTQRDLVRNSLRMRPDRIILGEVRGQEAFDMLQAMNTGHDGSLTTIHANSPRDALMRLETMVAMANLDIPSEFLRRYISSAINVVIHVARQPDGTRKVTSVQEITGMEGNVITTQEIFSFERTRIDPDGTVRGRFISHGVRPRFLERFAVAGIKVPPGVFDSSSVVEV